MPTPFEVLGIDADADDAAVVDAYRRRVKETHPDHGGSAAEFRAVQTAYERIRAGEIEPVPVPESDGDGDGDDGGERGHETADADGEEPPADRDGDAGEEAPPTVEYLDYEAVVDRGWSLDDGDLFEKAAAAGLDDAAYGRIAVEGDESLLEAAESEGFAWPYACRGGACANCAVAMVDGDLSLPVDHILPSEMTGRGIRLSCVGAPTGDAKVVFNVKHLPDLDDLRLPPRPFRGRSGSDD